MENTYRYREEALNTCINYSQEKISKAAQDNDRAGQRQAQMQVRFNLYSICSMRLLPNLPYFFI